MYDLRILFEADSLAAIFSEVLFCNHWRSTMYCSMAEALTWKLEFNKFVYEI